MIPAAPSKELIASGSSIQPLKKKAATSSSKPKRVKMLGKLFSLLSLHLDIFLRFAPTSTPWTSFTCRGHLATSHACS
jgi:hypothetical protein